MCESWVPDKKLGCITSPEVVNPSQLFCVFNTWTLAYQNIFGIIFSTITFNRYRCRDGKKCLEEAQTCMLSSWKKPQKTDLIDQINYHNLLWWSRLLIFSATLTVPVSACFSLNVAFLSSIQNCSVSDAMYCDVNTELLEILYIIGRRSICAISQGYVIILWYTNISRSWAPTS